MNTHITTQSEAQTQDVARQMMVQLLADPHVAEKPLILMLYGNLGAGKTAFMKVVADMLGITDLVSPAFVVYYEYPIDAYGFKYLYHFDLYRITEESEFDHLGVEDVVVPGNVIAIEWSEKSGPIDGLLRERGRVIEVHIEHGGGDVRNINMMGLPENISLI